MSERTTTSGSHAAQAMLSGSGTSGLPDGWLRRLRLATATAVASQTFVIASLTVVTLAIVSRLFGWSADAWVPGGLTTWIVLPFVLSAVAAILALRRFRSEEADHALFDQRAGLGGLLMVGRERELGDHADELRERIEQIDTDELLEWSPKRSGWRLLGGAVGLLALALLPAVAPATTDVPTIKNQSLANVLETTRGEIELARDDGALREEQGEELERRAEDIRQRLIDGDDVAWGDVDSLESDLKHAQESRQAGLQSVVRDVQEFASSNAESSSSAPGKLTPEQSAQLSELLRESLEEDLLDQTPPELSEALTEALAETLRQAQQDAPQQSSSDLSSLESLSKEQMEALSSALEAAGQNGNLADPALQELLNSLSPEQLSELIESMCEGGACPNPGELGKLAAALGENAAEALKKLAEQGRLTESEIADLDQLVAQMRSACQGGSKPGAGRPSGRAGRGGITRGPGSAPVDLTHETDGSTDGLAPKALTPGAPIPDRWMDLGVSRAEPVVAPIQPAEGSGQAPQAGTGRRTESRRLAPRHREAVRRFFSTDRRGR